MFDAFILYMDAVDFELEYLFSITLISQIRP